MQNLPRASAKKSRRSLRKLGPLIPLNLSRRGSSLSDSCLVDITASIDAAEGTIYRALYRRALRVSKVVGEVVDPCKSHRRYHCVRRSSIGHATPTSYRSDPSDDRQCALTLSLLRYALFFGGGTFYHTLPPAPRSRRTTGKKFGTSTRPHRRTRGSL